MILLCGVSSEPPVRLVSERLAELAHPCRVIDQRAWPRTRIDAVVRDGRVTGSIAGRDREGEEWAVDLTSVTGVYSRLMDDRRLPDVVDLPEDSRDRVMCRDFHEALSQWIEVTPARVLNRARPQASNGSKPYQAQLVRDVGFSVPSTVVTNDPEVVLAFRRRHSRIIYKSASGARSVVRELVDDDLEVLERVRWCPVQFQELVPGRDVRVHVVGGEAFASSVDSTGVDYRYAPSEGGETTVAPIDLEPRVRDACIDLAERLELPLAGIDLRLAPDGRVVCFEVNPSPGYSWYESQTGQPISAAIARHLAGG